MRGGPRFLVAARIVLPAAVLLAALPGSAAARTSVTSIVDDRFDGAVLTIEGGPGENDIEITDDGYRFTVTGRQPLTAKTGCTQIWPSIVRCDGALYRDRLYARMGRGDDSLRVVSRFSSCRIRGDGGDDLMKIRSCRGTMRGGPGSDRLIGSGKADEIFGGRGRDVLIGRDGADMLDGGPGYDVMLGDGGRDLIFAADGRADAPVSCGSGNDYRVRIDAADPRPAADCERFSVGSGTKSNPPSR